LGKLDNIDKHRRLTLTTGAGIDSETAIKFSDKDTPFVATTGTPFRHGAVLTSYSAPTTPGGYVDVKGRLGAYVAFDETVELPSLAGADVAYVLRQVLAMLRDKVVPDFESLS
jgi:hypothetical protein